MKPNLMIGIALTLIGASILAYRGFSYKTEETVLDLGPIKATAERTKNVALPPILGWVLIGSGACVIAFGSRAKT